MLREINNKDVRIPGLGQTILSTSPLVDTVVGVVPLQADAIQSGDVVRVRAALKKGIVNSSTFQIKLFWNTASSLNGSQVQLGTFTCEGTDASPSLHRVFVAKSSSSIDIFNSTQSSSTSGGIALQAGSTVSGLNFATSGYFIVTVIRTASGRSNDNIELTYISVEI